MERTRRRCDYNEDMHGEVRTQGLSTSGLGAVC